MFTSKVLPWIAAALVWASVSYSYHPSTVLIIAGTVIGTALSGLIFWSGDKVPVNRWWILKVAAMATVAGLMNSTALDVAYSLFAAPAGNRLPMLYEMIGSGVLLTLLAAIKVLLGPKKVK